MLIAILFCFVAISSHVAFVTSWSRRSNRAATHCNDAFMKYRRFADARVQALFLLVLRQKIRQLSGEIPVLPCC